MKKADNNQLSFTWCLHCECAYKTELWVKNKWNCPDVKCNGSQHDAHSWEAEEWPRINHPEYPEIPEEGKYYPLYE